MSPSVSRTFSDAFGNTDQSAPTKKTIIVDEEGFQTVSYKDIVGRNIGSVKETGNQEKKVTFGSKLKNLSVVTGKRVVNKESDNKFAAAPRDIFVYNTHPDITIEDVKKVLDEAQIKTFGTPVKKSHDESWMASFHVRVCHDDYEKLQNPEIWPIGWKCRDFIRRRPRPQSDNQQSGQQGGRRDPALLSVGAILRALQGSQLNQNGGHN